MSHYTKVKTKIKNLDTLERALGRLGLHLHEGGKARGWQGRLQRADAIIPFMNYDVGFTKDADGNYEMGADWDMIPEDMGFRQAIGNVEGKRPIQGRDEVEKFRNMVNQAYSEAVIRDVAFEQGLMEDECHIEEDGTIVLEYLE